MALHRGFVADDWNPKEIAIFESAICAFGKKFDNIAKLVRWRCVMSRLVLWRVMNRSLPVDVRAHTTAALPDWDEDYPGGRELLLLLEEERPLPNVEGIRPASSRVQSRETGSMEGCAREDDRLLRQRQRWCQRGQQ